MKKITLTITALVTDDGYEDEIDSILDDGIKLGNETSIETKYTYKITSAIDNKFAEITKTIVKVEQAKIE